MDRLRSLLASGLLLSILALMPCSATRAESPAVSYAPGWNMVGGPPGTDLSAAKAVYAYTAGGYVISPSMTTTLCQGEWAYFAAPTTLPISNQGPPTVQQDCSLQSGWNLIGNPFPAPAALPSGMTAYHWNLDAGRYDLATSIPIGSGVWIYATSSASVILQAPTQAPTPTSSTVTPVSTSTPNGTPQPTNVPQAGGTVVITLPFQPDYQAYVGDTVILSLPNSISYTASTDPAYLQLIDSGQQVWRWRAVAAGKTRITIDPMCRQATPPCGAPSISIRIDIVP